MILILRPFWKQESNLSLQPVGAINPGHSITCKYNSAYSIGKLFYCLHVFKAHAFMFGPWFELDGLAAPTTPWLRVTVSYLLAMLDTRRWGMTWLSVKLQDGDR
ncbi:hypothetical protein TIFTF001_032778 [Ficus carica]|uniref:Uncharacterized protein n=1 Tax=Ficus carica TaxID=3494 RepID=A0AA88DY03_FICCA|nr:hypothetical protein TIFTF001_032778 [Ficus carica]